MMIGPLFPLYLLGAWVVEKILRARWEEKLQRYERWLNFVLIAHTNMNIINPLTRLLKINIFNKLDFKPTMSIFELRKMLYKAVIVFVKEQFKYTKKINDLLTTKFRKQLDEEEIEEVERKEKKIKEAEKILEQENMEKEEKVDYYYGMLMEYVSESSNDFKIIKENLDKKIDGRNLLFIILYILGSIFLVSSFLLKVH